MTVALKGLVLIFGGHLPLDLAATTEASCIIKYNVPETMFPKRILKERERER